MQGEPKLAKLGFLMKLRKEAKLPWKRCRASTPEARCIFEREHSGVNHVGRLPGKRFVVWTIKCKYEYER